MYSMKRGFLVIGAIILAVLVVGIIFFVLPKPQPSVNCEQIEDASEKIECYKNLLQENKDMTICKDIDNGYIKDMCYSNFALVTEDYSICQDYVSSSWKEQCYVEIVKSKKNVDFCEELPNRELVTYCYSSFVIQEKDISICEGLGDKEVNKPIYTSTNYYYDQIIFGSEKDYCYYRFADYKVRMNEIEGVSTCEMIKNEPVRNTCFADFAERFKDDSICENIKESEVKEDCIELANMPLVY